MTVLETARALGEQFAAGAPERDRTRTLPRAEMDALSASGLLGITVPARFGGVEASVSDLAEVFLALAEGDPSVAQIPQSHFTFLEALRLQGTAEQQAFWFSEALAGKRFANAQSERATPGIDIDLTTLSDSVLSGVKFYCTGALLADWLVVRAVVGDVEARPQNKVIVFVRADAPGVTIEDDWDGFGQRTTASGTVRLDNVSVESSAVVSFSPIFTVPTTYGARAQLLHAAIDAGIGRAAVRVAREALAKARPHFEAGVADAADDPLLIQQFGDVEVGVRAAYALVRDAARSIDAAEADLTDAATAEASIATAAAKVASVRAALDAAAALFDAGGTRAAAASLGLDRLWRDARTHTLHDPVRWKVQHIGRYALSGTRPPRHGLI
ncbi:SfnB family sulfur acquisition oxidoreductase [Rhodococcoides trifolii]|uniref:SfnB family sulfur acquisition oxidoreductase n=1 Tax=Rhodococcoides trifolii TaxID=908250 RepID=A0A917CWR8_9NOCA|nr:SfnB family sulfur acquisition oxidoreductase [Rhodococcus trifolii]GGG00355.1 SfnB family sulfur acquisition oxidoreductase [Rhodococcus trifolii]